MWLGGCDADPVGPPESANWCQCIRSTTECCSELGKLHAATDNEGEPWEAYKLKRSLIDLFERREWTAGIVGLGYVGLPLAVTASHAGLQVVGFDVDSDKVSRLRSGDTSIEDVTAEDLKKALASGMTVTDDVSHLSLADAIFIAVPSPLGRNRQPDTSYIERAAQAIRQVARPGQLISLESTTYPGTTEEIIVPALEEAGLTVDSDVFVCFSPERVDPGNPLKTKDIPKVVGGVTPESGRVGVAAYERIVGSTKLVSSARAAELTKLLENTYRSVNIALINELAQVAHAFDIDIWEVVAAAATKPFGFEAFHPGPGVGGHCIPLDPQFLAWRARELRVATRFIDLAEDINAGMPEWVARRVVDELNGKRLPVSNSDILLVGMAYKRNIGDDRESPSVEVMKALEKRGAKLSVLDPHVEEARLARFGHDVVRSLHGGKWTLSIILTDHDDLDYEEIASASETVFDTRGVYLRLGLNCSNVVSL